MLASLLSITRVWGEQSVASSLTAVVNTSRGSWVCVFEGTIGPRSPDSRPSHRMCPFFQHRLLAVVYLTVTIIYSFCYGQIQGTWIQIPWYIRMARPLVLFSFFLSLFYFFIVLTFQRSCLGNSVLLVFTLNNAQARIFSIAPWGPLWASSENMSQDHRSVSPKAQLWQ